MTAADSLFSSPPPLFALFYFWIFFYGKGKRKFTEQTRNILGNNASMEGRENATFRLTFLCGRAMTGVRAFLFPFIFFTLHVGKPRHNLSVLTFSSPQIRALGKIIFQSDELEISYFPPISIPLLTARLLTPRPLAIYIFRHLPHFPQKKSHLSKKGNNQNVAERLPFRRKK